MWLPLLLSTLVLGVQAQDVTQVSILSPPQVFNPVVPTTEYIEDGKKGTVFCNATGQPTPIYRWRKDGVVIDPDNEYIKYNSNSGVLTFNSISQREEGTYMCEAHNRDGAASFSAEVFVKVALLTGWDNDLLKETTTRMDEYNYAMLPCEYNGINVGKNPGRFTWYQTVNTDQVDMDKGRLYMDTKGNLHFTYLKREDAPTTEEYRCGLVGANNPDAIHLGVIRNLEVTTVSAPSPTIPNFAYSNSGIQALLNSKATLECFFSGYDPSAPSPGLPTIEWQDNKYQAIRADNPDYTITSNGRRLEIRQVSIISEGNFYCKGVNSQGPTEWKAVELDVISPPVWVTGGRPTSQTVPEGRDAFFPCNAKSLINEEEADQPVWFVNGKQDFMTTNPGKFILSADLKMLTVKNLEKATDNLCVQCRVTNNYGNTWADACLTVILPITLVKRPEYLRQVISYGDRVDLTVVATTDPSIENLVYTWNFKNKTYNDAPPFVTYDPQTNEAYINTSRLDREEYNTIGGTYDRIVSNNFDRLTVSIQVILDDQAAAASTGSSFDWWIIGLILSIICLIIVIALIIFLCYRKAQEGDYNVDKKENGAGLDPQKELQQRNFDDFSPPAYADIDYPDKKPQDNSHTNIQMEYDDVPIGGDDESLGEYGEEDLKYFNDDGSFIGEYQTRPLPPRPRATESTI